MSKAGRVQVVNPRQRYKTRRIGTVAIVALLAFGITGSLAPSVTLRDEPMAEMMTARQLAQALYDQTAANQTQAFDPTRLRGMPWFSNQFGVPTFGSRDKGWGLGGLSFPDDTPQWQILARPHQRVLRRIKNQNALQDRHSRLNNIDKAHRWGNAIFVLGHELGHNLGMTWDEASADRWAKDHFKQYARQMGLNRQQVRRVWRANDKFSWVK